MLTFHRNEFYVLQKFKNMHTDLQLLVLLVLVFFRLLSFSLSFYLCVLHVYEKHF